MRGLPWGDQEMGGVGWDGFEMGRGTGLVGGGWARVVDVASAWADVHFMGIQGI